MFRKAMFALAASAAGCGGAQKEAPADPLAPRAAVPALEYRSAFADYRRQADAELAPWREVNDEVGRLGGHKGAHGAPR